MVRVDVHGQARDSGTGNQPSEIDLFAVWFANLLENLGNSSHADHVKPTSVTGQSAKPVTMAQDMPDRGLSIRCGSFSSRELARFKELLEKLIRLKPGWLDNEDIET
ncbi:hypothetical protein J1N35_023370 [Gossypium stocksii]|uniref:Uncharacterized protein n=1 Tax=Gossypium stocksii TaxID=47602 RepID=A0A9D3VJE6_9ROSI|nr:hypothetical protein J1N35_023370 [Gossypium stocksii]